MAGFGSGAGVRGRKALVSAGAAPDASAIEVAALEQELELLKARQARARARWAAR